MMTIAGILMFSVLAFFLSFQVVRKYHRLDRMELALYIVLIAWGSLIFGMFLSRTTAACTAVCSLNSFA